MESGAISDAQLTASSEYDDNSVNVSASEGRLHGPYAWSAETLDANQWLQIDLGINHPTVTRLATQGTNVADWDEWVTSYKLWYSDDGVQFTYYREQGQSGDKASQFTQVKTYPVT